MTLAGIQAAVADVRALLDALNPAPLVLLPTWSWPVDKIQLVGSLLCLMDAKVNSAKSDLIYRRGSLCVFNGSSCPEILSRSPAWKKVYFSILCTLLVTCECFQWLYWISNKIISKLWRTSEKNYGSFSKGIAILITFWTISDKVH